MGFRHGNHFNSQTQMMESCTLYCKEFGHGRGMRPVPIGMKMSTAGLPRGW